MDRSSIPHNCPVCRKAPECAMGILVYEGFKPPKCDHHKKPNPCHDKPITLVPAK